MFYASIMNNYALEYKIAIRLEGYPAIGMGHVYRGLQLADRLSAYELTFITSSKSVIAKQRLLKAEKRVVIIDQDEDVYIYLDKSNTDIIINDILNTTKEYIIELKRHVQKVINFEDLGDGASYADATINALYNPCTMAGNIYWGSDYYIARKEFLDIDPKPFEKYVHEILIMFGGTDPNDFTEKTIQSTKAIIEANHNIHLTVILGPGYPKESLIKEEISNCTYLSDRISVVKDAIVVSDYMRNADMAIASQGRTMYELAIMKVPTILLAQNERELTHEFGGFKNGYLNLGLGKEVENHTLMETIKWLINCPQIRKNMRDVMSEIDLLHGMERVKEIILS